MTYDYATLTDDQLRNLRVNASKRERQDIVLDVNSELFRRGKLKSNDATLSWNQERVRLLLSRFVVCSEGVQSNRRTTYTEAGGLKIGRSKDDPDRKWVDSYTAIKTDGINAVLVCYIPKPGDEPYFELHLDGGMVERYDLSRLDEAYQRWETIAKEASTS